MNSKERVLTAVGLGHPDRVPLDFSANAATLARLHRDLGTTTHRELLDRLHVDILDLRGVVDPIYCGPIPKERWLPGEVKENFWGWRTKVMETAMGPEECYVDFVLSGATSIEQLAAHPWPQPDWFDFTDFAARLDADAWQGLAIMASGASIWQHPTFLRGLERLLMDLLEAPELANYVMDRFTDFYVAYFDRMFMAAAGRIEILRIADDLGTQHGLLISPRLFDRCFAPRLAKLVDMAHSHGVKVMFHSCGAIVPFIERIISLGVDILDPLQVAADGMDPRIIKQRFGSRICLHGAIDTQYVLPSGTPKEVSDAVRRMVAILGAGGGFILAPSHVLQTDVPTENILALYETGYEQVTTP
jgi:uroporphyrinogen decarboxylase